MTGFPNIDQMIDDMLRAGMPLSTPLFDPTAETSARAIVKPLPRRTRKGWPQ